MSCVNCGCSDPCSCVKSGIKPYYTDSCLQQSQSHCKKNYICQYSPIVKVSNAWAVPDGNDLITLTLPALVDVLIGSVLWNPDFGSYLVVSFDEEGQKIKVQKSENNTVTIGTVIPSCTKFVVSVPLNDLIQLQYINFETNWNEGTGSGSVAPVLEQNQYALSGQNVYITLNDEVEISANTLNYIECDLPFTPASFTNLGQKVACTLFKLGTGSFPGYILLLPGSAKAQIYRTDGTPLAVGNWIIQENFFYKKGA